MSRRKPSASSDKHSARNPTTTLSLAASLPDGNGPAPLHPHQQLWVVPPPVAQLSRNGASVPSSSRTVFEPATGCSGRRDTHHPQKPSLPRRSRKATSPPHGREAAEQSRRSSLNLKGQRRVSDQLPPVVRMKHLVGWILKRSLDIARGKAELPVRSRDAAKKAKGKAKEADELPMFSEAELKLIRSRSGEFDSVLQQLLTDLNDGVSASAGMGATDEKEGKRQTPHPRNESNRKASAQLSAIVEAMRNESLAWSKELTRLEDYEAETSRLEALVDDEGAAESGDVIAWDRHDLDEAGLQQLRDAEAAMEWLQKLEAEDAADAPKAKSRTKGRASRAAQARGADDDNEQLQGTEHDPRWADVEFNVDLLRSRSHQFAQLESLASRYVRTVSAHAAQALRDRTSSSSALAGTSSSSAKRGRRKAATDTNDGGHGSSERLEALLSGVRESRSISTTGAESRPSAPDQSVADVSASTFVEPDESETTDLLRALARM
ncbi:uncharacterized protein PSANT_06285 [Moesziomyces antarcticus]|uniref:Kinetochore protein mis13 n=1 Tax=Pseudozyma antarctica TaxID=84753 RepID=A0A5C3FW63_PSEA2|nr:uncharacterized protein PSANT_06285 [Moesziomyces antarcticus]